MGPDRGRLRGTPARRTDSDSGRWVIACGALLASRPPSGPRTRRRRRRCSAQRANAVPIITPFVRLEFQVCETPLDSFRIGRSARSISRHLYLLHQRPYRTSLFSLLRDGPNPFQRLEGFSLPQALTLIANSLPVSGLSSETMGQHRTTIRDKHYSGRWVIACGALLAARPPSAPRARRCRRRCSAPS